MCHVRVKAGVSYRPRPFDPRWLCRPLSSALISQAGGGIFIVYSTAVGAASGAALAALVLAIKRIWRRHLERQRAMVFQRWRRRWEAERREAEMREFRAERRGLRAEEPEAAWGFLVAALQRGRELVRSTVLRRAASLL